VRKEREGKGRRKEMKLKSETIPEGPTTHASVSSNYLNKAFIGSEDSFLISLDTSLNIIIKNTLE